MIYCKHNIDPVIRDLNKYLIDQENQSMKLEYFRTKAEQEFFTMSDIEIIEYQENLDDLKKLFDFVRQGKIEEARKALNSFIETVKEAFINNMIEDYEKEEQQEREIDEYIERYFLEKDHPGWY